MSLLILDLTHSGSHKSILDLSPLLQGIFRCLPLAVLLQQLYEPWQTGRRTVEDTTRIWRKALAQLFSKRGMCGMALPAAFLHTERK